MSNKARRDYIKKCNREFMDCVSECAENVIKGYVPMTGPQKANLRRRRKDSRVNEKIKYGPPGGESAREE